MSLAEVITQDAATVGFRVTVLMSIAVGFITISTFMWRLLTAIKSKARMEQRVENHLVQTEPLIGQFHLMQTAITSGELRHQAITERLDRFITTQDEINRHFRATLDHMQKTARGG